MASGDSVEPEITGTKPKTIKQDKQKLGPNHHRMYRSPVRPFFCCGSQISLNSITEIKDNPPVTDKDTDDDYEDIATDSDDLLEEVDNLALQQSPKKYDRASPRLNRTSLSWKRKKAGARQEKSTARKKFWSLKLKGKLQVSKGSHYASSSEICSAKSDKDVCVCTSLITKGHIGCSTSSLQGAVGGLDESHSHDEIDLYSQQVPLASTSNEEMECSSQDKGRAKMRNRKKDAPLPFINLNKLYPINDIDEQLIAQRRHEMEHGIEVEDVWILKAVNGESGLKHGGSVTSIVCSTNIKKPVGQYPSYGAMALMSSEAGEDTVDQIAKHNRASFEESISSSSLNLNMSPWMPNIPNSCSKGQVQCHTQVDYIHFLVPDLEKIVRSSFYWGVMDRYQAEKLIENKAEGTFLLRDSAQDEFLFSVSFRRYGRSLHARIEQWNHKFSFDSRDPGVYATDTVCGLIDHYKDPSCCMFFEPMLTLPLNRTFPFSLQHLARAAICSRITYDGISQLTLPRSLKEYLQFYHYKQKIRVRRFDNVA